MAYRPFLCLFHPTPMSTPSRPPASQGPCQLTVHLPPEINLKFQDYWNLKFATTTTQLALGYRDSVWIYSLPEFDLVDTINPGHLAGHEEPLRVYGRFLVVMCESYGSGVFEDTRCFLYIWNLSARKHIGTVICNSRSYKVYMSVSLPSAKISGDGKLEGTTPEWLQDPVLIVALLTDGISGDNLETYVLHCPDAENVEGGNERTQGFQLPMAPTMTLCQIHPLRCLASLGRMALTGGYDATVRAWDIMTGKCQMVFIGHNATVRQVDLDEERIYSTSDDHTIRMWDRSKGDCLHVFVGYFSKMFVTLPYLIATTIGSSVYIWDIVSCKLMHTIDNQRNCNLDQIQGKEHTLATIEAFEGSRFHCFRIWDLRSRRPIRTSSFESGILQERRFFQGRFFIGIAEEDEGHVLKVWDFGANYDSLDAEVGLGNDDSRSSTVGMTDEIGGIGKDDGGKPVAPFSSSSVVEGTLARGSTVRAKGKRNKAKNFILARDNSIDEIEEVMGDDCGMSVSPSTSNNAVEGALADTSMTASKRKRSPTPDLFPKSKREKNDKHDEQVSTSLT
ncbi:hypothetical protein CVT26_015435 [Gymnopilus dilepis]|uniref:Uncharacterized protein n=1 Tax=Gymnopilus dilepis TaxID=231916 RepID=A0A409YEK0_9AGAR|nr:hypothetical protein CVT26_015435 [Gymnopilus dilepis]